MVQAKLSPYLSLVGVPFDTNGQEEEEVRNRILEACRLTKAFLKALFPGVPISEFTSVAVGPATGPTVVLDDEIDTAIEPVVSGFQFSPAEWSALMSSLPPGLALSVTVPQGQGVILGIARVADGQNGDRKYKVDPDTGKIICYDYRHLTMNDEALQLQFTEYPGAMGIVYVQVSFPMNFE